jgi:predicted ATPase
VGELSVHSDLFNIKSELDYREKLMLEELNSRHEEGDWVRCFFTPVTSDSQRTFENFYAECTGKKPQKILEIEVNEGRTIKIPGVGNVCRIDFRDLMDRSWASNEFRAIFDHIRILFLENVSPIDVSVRNQAARFIMLVHSTDRRALQPQDQTVHDLLLIPR